MDRSSAESQTDPSTEQQHRLIRAAIAGDKQALSWLLDELTPVVQNRAARALLRYSTNSQARSIQQEVEDLTQEIFLWLFDNRGKILKSWNPKQGVPLVGFIGFVADRKAMGIMRTHKRSPWTEEPMTVDELEQRQNPFTQRIDIAGVLALQSSKDPECQIVSKELLRLVVERLNDSLTPLGKYLFSLLYVEQRSVVEVGQHMGMTLDAVYAWRSRLGRKSRQILNQIRDQEARMSCCLAG